MAVTVKIPAQLRATTDGESELTVGGSTVGVGDCIERRYWAHSS